MMRLGLFIGGILLFFPVIVLAIVVGPTRQTIVVTPEKETEVVLFVQNDSNNTKTYFPEIDAFVADKTGNIPVFGQYSESKNWITPKETSITLLPGERGEFIFTVSAPEGATPGVHYLGLFAREEAPAAAQVGVSTRAGSLLYLYIEGKLVEQLLLQQFSVDTAWVTKPTVTVNLITKNIGNIHVIPQGEIVVKNRKDKDITFASINNNGKKVLANNQWINSYQLTLDRKASLGKNRIQLFIKYGFQEDAIIDEISFWYLPWWIILTGGAAVIFIFIILKSLFSRR